MSRERRSKPKMLPEQQTNGFVWGRFVQQPGRLVLLALTLIGATSSFAFSYRRPPDATASNQPSVASRGTQAAPALATEDSPDQPSRPGMVWIPATTFVMGSQERDALQNEQPAHSVKLRGYWIDDHEVTNAEFERFVEATGYVTTAEVPPDWEQMQKDLPAGTPKPADDVLVPGSLVFVSTAGPVRTDDVSQWWKWTPGASWKHPEGPDSSIIGREDHPVVHVSWDDALAYATWAGKSLPTEAQWECAARGKLAGQRFSWGSTPPSDREPLANIWQGNFPHRNTRLDGWERTSPVKQFAANGYGLYDMSGNVWEWCSDWYRFDAYREQTRQESLPLDPQGPSSSWDPDEPNAAKRVIRGGSFLCHVTYCESYRAAARRGNTPDTGMSHLGFRCVVNLRSSLSSQTLE